MTEGGQYRPAGTRRRLLLALLGTAAVLAACTSGRSAGPSSTRGDHRPPPTAYELPRVVHPVSFAREAGPQRFATAPSTATCEATMAIACYGPSQLQAAYDLGPLYHLGDNGKGETIVIVDCFGSPTIAADLATFDAAFHLAPPPSLSIVRPAGPLPAWDPASNGPMIAWGEETSLDVEYAHAMAPGARIVLVETPVAETEGTAGFPQIEKAETWAIEHEHPAVISQSFGATEGTFPSTASILGLRGAYVLAKADDVTVLSATGDDGSTDYSSVSGSSLFTSRAIDWPASDPLVTAVGGLQLHLTPAGVRLLPDNVWNDSNLFGTPSAGSGGVSKVFARPSYQAAESGVVGPHRGVPDISLSAAQDGGAVVYESFPGTEKGFSVIGGTSEATPLMAGIVAIADQVAGKHLGLLDPYLYRLASEHAPGLVDVTVGSNTVTFEQEGTTVTVPGYAAVPGYDLASGLGTVDAALLAPELKAAAG